MCHRKEHKVRARKGSGISGNPEYVGVGTLVGVVHCWLLRTLCVSVLGGGGIIFLQPQISGNTELV